MTLRQRLAVTTLAVGLPLVAGLIWFHNYAREHAAEDAFAQLAALHMQNGGRERCEESPSTWAEGPIHLGNPITHTQPWDGPLGPLRVMPSSPRFGSEPRRHHGLQLYAYDNNFESQTRRRRL